MSEVTIHAYQVSPAPGGCDCTCYPFKAGDEAEQQAAFDYAQEHIAENAENLELDGEASISLVVVEPDECCDCEAEECECRQSSGDPEFKPAWEKEATT